MFWLSCFTWVFSGDLNSQGLVEQMAQMNAGIVCDSLSCCQSMCRLYLEIRDWDGKQVSPRPRSRVEAVLIELPGARGLRQVTSPRECPRPGPQELSGSFKMLHWAPVCLPLVFGTRLAELKLQLRLSNTRDTIAGVDYMVYLTLRT